MSESSDNQPKSRSFFIRLLSAIGKIIKGYFISVGVFVTLGPIILILLVSYYQKKNEALILRDIPTQEIISKNTLVELELKGQLVDKSPDLEDQLVQRFFGGPETVVLPKLRETMRRVEKDGRIAGVLIKLTQLHGSLSQFSELRRIFLGVKEAKKPVYFWLSDANNNSYFLASVGDEIALAPGGSIEIPGPLFTLMYLGDALRKVGVEFEVVRAGKYKSAFEMLVNNKPSDEVIEMYSSMEEALRNYITQETSANRNQDIEKVKQWYRESLFTADGSKNEGLVNDLFFYEDYRQLLEKRHSKKDKPSSFLSFQKYWRQSQDVEKDDVSGGDDGIAVIYAEGEIVLNAGANEHEAITPDTMQKQLVWAREKKEVKAVVFRINSPGGSALASDLIWHHVNELAKKKPVIVSMGSVAASGGYYIAAPAKKIIADPATITGSIGVIGALPNVKAFEEKYGISFFAISQSERKNLYNPGAAATGFDKEALAHSIDVTYQQFLQRVAAGRKMTTTEVDALGQGRVYTGTQALELGLVDDIGGLSEAIVAAKLAAGLNEKKLYPLHQYEPEELDWRECLHNMSKMYECFKEIDAKILFHKIQKPVFRQTQQGLATVIYERARRFTEEPAQALWIEGPLQAVFHEVSVYR